MPWWAAALLAALVVYAAFVLALVALGRHSDARALAGFVPDCGVLLARLARHPCVPRRRRLLVAALVGYLAAPIDLVPDFIPVAGQLDDALIAAWVLRRVARGCTRAELEALWPGPQRSLELVLRLAGAGR